MAVAESTAMEMALVGPIDQLPAAGEERPDGRHHNGGV
jgi:hypothetical protein